MKIAIKTIAKIEAKGYKFSYTSGTKCFIEYVNGGGLANGRRLFFDTPTKALNSIK